MTLTPNELLAMVNKLNERPMPNMQEDNWEELESDDGHLELYLDGIDEQRYIVYNISITSNTNERVTQ